MRAVEYLAKIPGVDDRLLAHYLHIRENEAKKIRRKLSKVLESVVFPNYGLLGWELIFVAYSTLPVKEIPSQGALDGCTHVYCSSEYFLAIGFAQNYSELVRIYEKLCLGLKVSQEHLKLVIFAHEFTEFLRFFDYQHAISRITGNRDTGTSEQGSTRHKGLDILSRKILYQLVGNPAMDENTLSKKLGTSLRVIKRKLSFLRTNGYCVHSVNVDLEMLGYTGLAFYHLEFSHKERMEEFLQDTQLPAIFVISDGSNAFLLVPYTQPDEIFETSVSISARTYRRHAVSIVNYGYFQFSEMNKLRENEYLSVLGRNKNFMFGDVFESVIAKPEGRGNKTNTRNRR
ncbi:MAG: hypothetical protein QW620_01095 [Thermoplasmata archaeon]